MERLDPNEPHQVENRSSVELIPDEVRPTVDQMVAAYSDIFGDDLSAVYLEGSAGRGDYQAEISDIDLVGLIHRPQTDEELARLRAARNTAIDSTGIHKIDIAVKSLESLKNRPHAQFILAKDAVLLTGEPFEPTTEFPPIGPDLAKFLDASIPKDVLQAHEALKEFQAGDEVDLAFIGRWLSKKVLRLGLGIAMTRIPKYTASMKELPDLVRDTLPELAEEVNFLQQYYLEPVPDEVTYAKLLEIADKVVELAAAAGITQAD